MTTVMLSQLIYLTKPRNIILITCHSPKPNRQLKIKHTVVKHKKFVALFGLVAFKHKTKKVAEENIIGLHIKTTKLILLHSLWNTTSKTFN